MSKKPVKKWKRIVKRIIVLLIVLMLIAAAGYYAYTRLKSEYTVTYQSYTVTRGSISNSLSFSGSFALVNSASYTATSSGTVRTLYVQNGDSVKEGDKLMRLSNGDTYKADCDGTVNALTLSEGDSVTSGATLMQVADFTHMSVSLRIDEYDIADVSVGTACTVTATASEKTFDSTIAAINYISASGGSVAYYTATVYVDVDEGIYPGMQVTVTVPLEEANDVIILKEDALSFDNTNSAYVWMYNDEGVLEQVYVTVGVSNGNYVEISSGLEEGDEVYVEVQEDTTTSGGLLSSLFGSTQMQQTPGGTSGGFDRASMGDFDPSTMGGRGSSDSSSSGSFPGGGNMGGGN